MGESVFVRVSSGTLTDTLSRLFPSSGNKAAAVAIPTGHSFALSGGAASSRLKTSPV
jgi:hypothetical protein